MRRLQAGSSHPRAVIDGERIRKRAANHRIQQGEPHVPGCLEQPLRGVCGEQPQQHKQQPEHRAAAVVFRFEDQLRRGRCRRPFAGRRPSGQPAGAHPVADQRHGRRRPSAGRRWRPLAGHKPAQPRRHAGYRSLQRHPQQLAGYGSQPGVPVDPVGNLQHRLHDHLQPGAGVQLQHQHLHRRLFHGRVVDRRSEYSARCLRPTSATPAA